MGDSSLFHFVSTGVQSVVREWRFKYFKNLDVACCGVMTITPQTCMNVFDSELATAGRVIPVRHLFLQFCDFVQLWTVEFLLISTPLEYMHCDCDSPAVCQKMTPAPVCAILAWSPVSKEISRGWSPLGHDTTSRFPHVPRTTFQAPSPYGLWICADLAHDDPKPDLHTSLDWCFCSALLCWLINASENFSVPCPCYSILHSGHKVHSTKWPTKVNYRLPALWLWSTYAMKAVIGHCSL